MIKHVLKDGTVVKDITGHRVESETVSQIILRMNERRLESEKGRTGDKVG